MTFCLSFIKMFVQNSILTALHLFTVQLLKPGHLEEDYLFSNSLIIHKENTKEVNVEWVLEICLLLKSCRLRSNIKHSTQCFITRWNTFKFVKNTPLQRRIFNSLLSVSSGDETLRLMLDILHEVLIFVLIRTTLWTRSSVGDKHRFLRLKRWKLK